MEQLTKSPKSLLKKGLEYTKSNLSNKYTGTETFGLTNENYVVDLVVQRDPDGNPRSATVYMSNQAACLSRELLGLPECKLDLLFEGDQLKRLISSSPNSLNEPTKGKENPPPSLTGGLGNADPPPRPLPNAAAGLLLPALMADLVVDAVFGAVHVVLQLRKRNAPLRSVLRNESYHEDMIAAMQVLSDAAHVQVSKPAVRPFYVNDKKTSRESQADINRQIEEISLCLDSPEQQITIILVMTSLKAHKIGKFG